MACPSRPSRRRYVADRQTGGQRRRKLIEPFRRSRLRCTPLPPVAFVEQAARATWIRMGTHSRLCESVCIACVCVLVRARMRWRSPSPIRSACRSRACRSISTSKTHARRIARADSAATAAAFADDHRHSWRAAAASAHAGRSSTSAIRTFAAARLNTAFGGLSFFIYSVIYTTRMYIQQTGRSIAIPSARPELKWLSFLHALQWLAACLPHQRVRALICMHKINLELACSCVPNLSRVCCRNQIAHGFVCLKNEFEF